MSRHLLAPMLGISEAFTEIRLNDPVSEVDITKYQQLCFHIIISETTKKYVSVLPELSCKLLNRSKLLRLLKPLSRQRWQMMSHRSAKVCHNYCFRAGGSFHS